MDVIWKLREKLREMRKIQNVDSSDGTKYIRILKNSTMIRVPY